MAIKDLRGTTAILTGASRGLGVTIAKRLAAEGVNLALAARSADALEDVRKLVEEAGVRAAAIPTDVADRAQLEALLAETERQLGPPDILVNNAGIEVLTPYDTYPPEEIEALVAVNLTAPMLLTRFVLPGMLERGRGHIVNIASLAGKSALPCEAPYATTKAGLVMFTQALRTELAGTPVDASAVCPGLVSDEGMYARIEEQGFPAPWWIGTTTPQKVADAVVKAIKRGSSELIVNGTPLRVPLAAAQVFPDATAYLYRVLGVTRYARKAAEAKAPGRL
jgi:short-subunit dehydrogenase